MYTIGTTEAGLHYLPLTAENGDYLYDPCYLCIECWQHILDEIREHTRDIPPVADDQSSCECNVCGSGIRLGELFGLTVLGQLQVSARCPDNVNTPTFQMMKNDPTIICIGCINVMERDVAELWGGRITQYDECEEGSFLRCWRYGCGANSTCLNIKPKEID
jgi:hypothetical protein